MQNTIELLWEDFKYEFVKKKEVDKTNDFNITFRAYLKCREKNQSKACKYYFLLFKIRDDANFDPKPEDNLNIKFE